MTVTSQNSVIATHTVMETNIDISKHVYQPDDTNAPYFVADSNDRKSNQAQSYTYLGASNTQGFIAKSNTKAE